MKLSVSSVGAIAVLLEEGRPATVSRSADALEVGSPGRSVEAEEEAQRARIAHVVGSGAPAMVREDEGPADGTEVTKADEDRLAPALLTAAIEAERLDAPHVLLELQKGEVHLGGLVGAGRPALGMNDGAHHAVRLAAQDHCRGAPAAGRHVSGGDHVPGSDERPRSIGQDLAHGREPLAEGQVLPIFAIIPLNDGEPGCGGETPRQHRQSQSSHSVPLHELPQVRRWAWDAGDAALVGD